jgi:hypothetical protein
LEILRRFTSSSFPQAGIPIVAEAQNPAQHENMNNRVKSADILRAPAHHLTGRQLVETVRDAWGAERGYKLTIARLSAIIGKSVSTTGYLLGVHEQSAVLAFMCALERLSDSERYRILNSACRTLPTVLHPRVSHSPGAAGALLKLLAQQRELSIVRGGTPASRSFVLLALGHTFPQLDPKHRTAGGLDIHQPSKIVPVESMLYLRNPLSPGQARQVVQSVWPEIRTSQAPLLLFNGVWSLVPEFRDEMLNWAKKRHVIVADDNPPDRSEVARKKIKPVHVLTLSQVPGSSNLIRINCQKPRAS